MTWGCRGAWAGSGASVGFFGAVFSARHLNNAFHIEQLVQVQQRAHCSEVFGHPEDVAGVQGAAKIGRGFNICFTEISDIFNGVQIPWLSLAAFIVLAFLLIVYLRKSSR